ncbi:MAG: hypothetical protein QM756_40185 [Polyangiaceae bacterium]
MMTPNWCISAAVAALYLASSGAAMGHDGAAEAFVPVTAPPSAPRTLRASNREAPEATDAALLRQRWLLSVEAVTHAPVDVGAQLGVQTPFGLRLFGGAGFIPPMYSHLLRGVAASAAPDERARALLEQGEYTGSSFRLQLGIAPFKRVGLYLDAGYAHVSLSGSANLAESENAQLAALGGTYQMHTGLDMWLVELGYQGQVAERFVLGMAFGVMGTLDSATTLTRSDGGASSALFADFGAPGGRRIRILRLRADAHLARRLRPALTRRCLRKSQLTPRS